MPNVKLASLATSRVSPRPATTNRSALPSVTIPPLSTALILAANVNRTLSTLENTSATDALYIGYGVPGDSQVPNGFKMPPQSAYNIDVPEAIYGDNRTANPITVSIDEGEG